MTELAASSTAVLVCQGRASALVPPSPGPGFDRQAVTTWVWEGIVHYVTADQVRTTLSQIAELSAPDSRLVVNYQTKSLPTTVMRAAMRLVLRVSRQPAPLVGESWRSRWRPDGMRSMLSDNGFDVTSDDDLLTLAERLALPRRTTAHCATVAWPSPSRR